MFYLCVCVCVKVRKRERKKEKNYPVLLNFHIKCNLKWKHYTNLRETLFCNPIKYNLMYVCVSRTTER